MSDTLTRFAEREARVHAASVARGEHDDQCEYGPREHNGRPTMFRLCHCSKRRREATGYTAPPGPLIHNAPSCPRCYADVVFDGDAWVCRPCCVSWGTSDGYDRGEFTDDYGDLSR